jgi:hypothetical protein
MDLASTYFYHPSSRTRQKSMAYLSAYERHLSKFRERDVVMYEIGCGYPSSLQPVGARGMGGSLEVFKSWLGSRAKIIGVDIIPECIEYESTRDNIYIEIGSQSDPDFLAQIINKYGEPDIVLDDGSHRDVDMKATFDFLFKELKTGGVYLIEDIGGNHIAMDEPLAYDSDERFIAELSRKYLELNQFYAASRQSSTTTGQPFMTSEFGFMASSVCFYPNLVVIEKNLNVPIDQCVAPPHFYF